MEINSVPVIAKGHVYLAKAGSLLGSQGPFHDGEQGLDLLDQMCFQTGWNTCRARGPFNPEIWIKVFTGKQVC